MIRELLKNKIVKNAGWILCGRIAQMITSLFVGILSARYLGPSNYGLINYASAYTSFFASVSTLGINSVIGNIYVLVSGQTSVKNQFIINARGIYRSFDLQNCSDDLQ